MTREAHYYVAFTNSLSGTNNFNPVNYSLQKQSNQYLRVDITRLALAKPCIFVIVIILLFYFCQHFLPVTNNLNSVNCRNKVTKTAALAKFHSKMEK